MKLNLKHQWSRNNLVKLSLSEEMVLVLLENISRGAAHSKVGFEDADRTRGELERALRGRAVEVGAVESALWSCCLLDEEGEFYHPRLTFDQFLGELLPPSMEFDKFFCLIREKEDV